MSLLSHYFLLIQTQINTPHSQNSSHSTEISNCATTDFKIITGLRQFFIAKELNGRLAFATRLRNRYRTPSTHSLQQERIPQIAQSEPFFLILIIFYFLFVECVKINAVSI